jgi:hypothetical protein
MMQKHSKGMRIAMLLGFLSSTTSIAYELNCKKIGRMNGAALKSNKVSEVACEAYKKCSSKKCVARIEADLKRHCKVTYMNNENKAQLCILEGHARLNQIKLAK